MKKLIITHKNCIDGKCSKAVLKGFFNGGGHYLELDHANLHEDKDERALEYKNEIMSFKNTEVVMADFCLPIEMIETLIENNNKIVILDHHETSIPIVEHFEKRMDEDKKLNIDINFCKENNRSGAWLSWEYLYPGKEMPDLVKYVSDGDIWKFRLGDKTKFFYTGFFHLYDDASNCPESVWEELLNDNIAVHELIKEGEPIHERFMQEVRDFVPFAKEVVLGGYKGLMVEAPKKYTSDLGNLLAQYSGTFGMVYQFEEPLVKCSLRSVAPFSVKDIAEKFEGGGHGQASAFRCRDKNHFMEILESESIKNINPIYVK